MKSGFTIDLRIKEKIKNHYIIIDRLERLTPEEAIILIRLKYSTSKHLGKVGKFLKIIDKFLYKGGKDIEVILGINNKNERR